MEPLRERKKLFDFQRYLQVDAHDTLKLVLAALTFFFIIGAYSILRSLKTSIFLGFVGREYEPFSKIISIIITIPAMIVHAKVTDNLKKHQVVCFFLGMYTILVTLFTFLFAHPVYGVSNTLTSPYRLTGWAFEISMDLFQALIVGTFWSFISSISTPTLASKGYGFIVAGSRIGGILTPFIGWLILEQSNLPNAISIPLVTGSSAVLLLLAIVCVYLIYKKIPSSHMHGYEATYQIEHKQEDQKPKASVFEGLKLMLAEPYVLGIFGLVFSFEVVNIIFDYQMHILMSIETNNHVGAMSSFMLMYTGTFQTFSLILALFGTSKLLKRFGVQYSILVMPIATIGLALLPMIYPKLITIFIVMVLLRGFNYGFNHPLREILFIPTVKDIRFKSKAWIESFGRTVSKTTGSTFNMLALLNTPYFCIILESCVSIVMASIWALIALFVGRTYLKTVTSNGVIGKKKNA
jgi:AAA family ATP:ADP antiporter